MKLSKYDRREKLKAKGIHPLPFSTISKGTSDKGQAQYWFESETALRAYASTVCIAEKGERDLWNHYGWFTSEFQDETLKPVVAIIGQGAFYGYCESYSGCIVLIYDGRKEGSSDAERDSQLRDLASSADCIAERAANKEREYNERWKAASRIEAEIEDKEAGRAEHFEKAREAVADIRANRTLCPRTPRIESWLAGHFSSLRHNRKSAASLTGELRDLKEKLATEFKDVL